MERVCNADQTNNQACPALKRGLFSFGAGVFRGGNPQSMFNTGWSPGSGSLSAGSFAGADAYFGENMKDDAEAVKNGSMSHQEYGAK